MSRLVFSEVNHEEQTDEDQQLTRLIARPMPGNLSLSFGRDPSYLKACARCGPPRRVLIAKDKDKIVALTSFFLRRYWWNEEPQEIWTLSDFRALPSKAGFGITGQGWRALRQLLDHKPAIISVVADNPRALALFSKPRPGWPRLHPVGDLRTNLTPLLFTGPPKNRRYLTRPLTAEELQKALKDSRPPLQPVVEDDDFGTTLPPTHDYWGVFDNDDTLLGFAGLHDQSAHRQIRIHSYAGWYQTLAKLRLLPKPGREIPLRTASLLHCPDPKAWVALKQRLEHEAKQQKAKFLVWCKAGRAPLNLSFAYRSRIYQLVWEGEKPLPALAKEGQHPLSFEVAWL